ncbi:MAG TPA: ribose-5-phosphate isomerase RpiA [Gemmataceae bacterium]|jgi:ribose 5-phosphate isomerase A|nr:ribose-5-phosphate isomerase RpiA [Gemmataceae bacterium]
MTIFERAVNLVPDGTAIGLGSGRAARAFVEMLGERIRSGRLNVRGVPTSNETARHATEHGVPLIDLAEARELSIAVDGADEVDPQFNLIKGYGRALFREHIVAESSRHLIILVGAEKLVPQLGARGRLPVEVVPFALPLCRRRLEELGLSPVMWEQDGKPGVTDNGNYILDCATEPISDVPRRIAAIKMIPGVVVSGLFWGTRKTSVLVGDDRDFQMIEELTNER